MSNSESPQELTLSEFVETYIQRIAQMPGCDKVIFDPVNRVIRFEYQGQVQFARPQSAYAEYKKDISRLDALLNAHINGIHFTHTEAPRSFAAVAPSLMPMVRDRRYLDLALLTGRVSGPRVLELSEIAPFPYREIAGELVLTLVRDSADSTLLVSESDLKPWGVSFDQACEVAMKNLRGRTELRMEELVPGLYGSKWHDTYDATRLLLTDLLRKLPLSGDLVVAAPTRTHLLVAGSDNRPALAAMISTAVQLLDSDPKPLSADVLQFTGNRWTESWLHDAPALVNARCNLLYRDYAQQKEMLDKLHQANGTELFVASYRLAKADGNGEPLVNVAQLTEGVVTLLPKADYLMLMTRARETLIVTWADAEAVMGGMLKKLNIYPLRYLADTFPNPQQLTALRAKVVKFAKAGRQSSAAKAGPHRIATQEPDLEMEQALASLRQRYAALQQNPTRSTFESMCAPSPSWLKPSDALSEVSTTQLRLLAEGKIFWAALVQANKLMFSPGTADCPGLLVYSTDQHFDARPHELRAIASRILELKGSTPADPELKEIATVVTDEMARSLGWKVPEALTDNDVRAAAFLIFRQHIPGRVLTASLFPILVHPSTQAVMIVPSETWPDELVRSWKPRTQERTLEEIRRLPEGLRVTHSPNPVAAIMGRDKDQPFVWEYITTVEALHAQLNIVEFGAFNLSNGNWRFSNTDGQPFSTQQFAEWYSCTDGVLKPGKPAADQKNWDRGKVLRSSRCIWYFIGKDAEGKLFRGEAEIEQRGTLVPPHSEAPAVKAPGGLAAVARVFGKAGAESLLRFDGVYRVKQQPRNDEDQKYCYLRLYSDKTALYTTSTENPSELTKSFNVKSGNVPQGDYKLSGNTIRIEIRAVNTTLVFSGTVDKNRMVLESKRFSDRPVVRDEFLFMGWRP